MDFLIRSSWVESRVASALIGWVRASLSILNAYCLVLASSHMFGGKRAASTSIGIIGAVLKTPRIFLRPKFCRACKGLLNWAWPFYQIGDP